MTADNHIGSPEVEAAKVQYQQTLGKVLAEEPGATILEADVRFNNFPGLKQEAGRLLDRRVTSSRLVLNPAVARFSPNHIEYYFNQRGAMIAVDVDARSREIVFYGSFAQNDLPTGLLAESQLPMTDLPLSEERVTLLLQEAAGLLKDPAGIRRKKFITPPTE